MASSASSLAFLPRNVSKQKSIGRVVKNLQDEVSVASGSGTSNEVSVLQETAHAALSASTGIVEKLDQRTESEQKKGFLKDEEYTRLLELSLSDYALWSDSEFQERMFNSEDSFVPLSYLLRCSSLFSGSTQHPPESTLVRCVKASSTLEACMILTESNSEASFIRKGKKGLDEESGGFAVRRKDWELLEDRIRRYTTFQWDHKTIYVENFPHYARTIPSVCRFIEELLADEGAKDAPVNRSMAIQAIVFPAHHAGKPGGPPPTKNKGFAFVVLSQRNDAERLLHRWPWSLDSRPLSAETGAASSGIVGDAFDNGFRSLSKNRWDELKEEYLALQQRLLKKVVEQSDEISLSIPHAVESDVKLPDLFQRTADKGRAVAHEEGTFTIPILCSYPKDCLVYIRNVHAKTNKTTLRSLFSHALAYDTDGADTAIDYVDYTKGLDNCYLRLTAPHFARILVSRISSHPLIQADALDNVGKSTEAESAVRIHAELMQGKREELYWDKVPEKVKAQAVEKARSREAASDTANTHIAGGESYYEHGGNKKRKRRHRG